MHIKTVGIIGFGRFGRLLADLFADDFEVRYYKRGLANPDALQEAASADAVFFSVAMLYLEEVVRKAKPFIRSDAAILDVCSVKLHPERVFREHFDMKNVLLTHPMFGPDSAKGGLTNLPIVLCPNSDTRPDLLAYWDAYFRGKGLRAIHMSADAHDRNTAHSLCMTQLLGRVLESMKVTSSEIDTESFRNLLKLRDIAINDSKDLFRGLQTLNPYAKPMRAVLKTSLETIEASLDAGPQNEMNEGT